jgi:hypothetical protein
MRLSVAGAAKDAQVQSGIFLSDLIRYLADVGRQPHPGPNFASCVLPGRPHRLAVALPLPEGGPTSVSLLGLLSVTASLRFCCSVFAFFSSLHSPLYCLFVALDLPFTPSCGPCPLILRNGHVAVA